MNQDRLHEIRSITTEMKDVDNGQNKWLQILSEARSCIEIETKTLVD